MAAVVRRIEFTHAVDAGGIRQKQSGCSGLGIERGATAKLKLDGPGRQRCQTSHDNGRRWFTANLGVRWRQFDQFAFTGGRAVVVESHCDFNIFTDFGDVFLPSFAVPDVEDVYALNGMEKCRLTGWIA